MRADKRCLLRRLLAVIITAGLFISLCLTASASAPAETKTPPKVTSAVTPAVTPTATPKVASTEKPAAAPETAKQSKAEETLPVYFDGLMYARARMEDGEVFVSPECVCRFLGLDMDWNADEKAMTLTVQGVELSAVEGREYMTVCGRYLYEPEGWIVADGVLYLPMDAIEKLFTVTIREKRLPHVLEINTENAAVIAGGEDYYELNYPMEDLFWLGQVIYSESYQQPLAGQIGVGNVVMNRVASEDFPNSVFTVVFDIEGVVQFEPVSTGGIYVTPDEVSQIAARLCLEGYNTVGDSLYFVNPSKGSFWFDNTLDFVMAIGEHNFYR